MNQLSGYDEFEVAGEILPFKFGVNANYLFCAHRGVELGQMGETGLYGTFEGDKMIKAPDMMATIEISYFAYVTAMRMKGAQPTINLTSFVEMVGDTKDVIGKFQQLMLTSRLLGYSMPELAEKGTKKK